MLRGADARGKNLLLDFGTLTLHSHLGMSGSWHRLPARRALGEAAAAAPGPCSGGSGHEAVQWGGPTLRVLRSEQLRRDAEAGPARPRHPLRGLRAVRGDRADPPPGPRRELGDALLDQRLLAGIGNVFKSEACFAAGLDPVARPGRGLTDAELAR